MRSRTLKQIASQCLRMKSALASRQMTEKEERRFAKVRQIEHKYCSNILSYLRSKMGPADLNEYGAVTSVPREIYSKTES